MHLLNTSNLYRDSANHINLSIRKDVGVGYDHQGGKLGHAVKFSVPPVKISSPLAYSVFS